MASALRQSRPDIEALAREAALEIIALAATLLFAHGQTTERTVVTAERLGRALGLPVRVLPDWTSLRSSSKAHLCPRSWLLGILYESLIHPITIISTLPSAGLGALLLLMAVHLDLSVIAIVGIILLIGIVKKNGIMLIDFAQHVEHQEGLTAEESIYRACVMRFRPILMTTMAALLGDVPMMLGTGVGSEIRQPLGYAIVGAWPCRRCWPYIRPQSSTSISTGFKPGYSARSTK